MFGASDKISTSQTCFEFSIKLFLKHVKLIYSLYRKNIFFDRTFIPKQTVCGKCLSKTPSLKQFCSVAEHIKGKRKEGRKEGRDIKLGLQYTKAPLAAVLSPHRRLCRGCLFFFLNVAKYASLFSTLAGKLLVN